MHETCYKAGGAMVAAELAGGGVVVSQHFCCFATCSTEKLVKLFSFSCNTNGVRAERSASLLFNNKLEFNFWQCHGFWLRSDVQ